MTYIVNDKCIKCKLMDCVEVCPVDCFYEGKNMLVIKPDECIDCGVCEPECPVDAIKADTEPGLEKWLEINEIFEKAKKMEEKSNQILDFTKEVKNMEENNKIKIVKTLWRIIFSNKKADIYEANLMRRLAGLLYIDSKIMGDIKEQIKKENS